MKYKLIVFEVFFVAILYLTLIPVTGLSQIIKRPFIPSRLQNNQAFYGEPATGKLTVDAESKDRLPRNSKRTVHVRELKAGQTGVFSRIAGIRAHARVPFEIIYPEGEAGEKVLLSALDGGKLDNGKGVKVVTLNSEKKVSFIFQTAEDRGLYRVSLSKGYDTKIVQIWVGAAPTPVTLRSDKNINLKTSF